MRRRGRTTIPAGPSPRASRFRRSASPTPRCSTSPMETVTGDVKAPSGVDGQGTIFAINHNADNALITLRYALKDADIQIAEEPFDASGVKFARGSFIISGVSQADLDKVTTDLGLKAHALAAAPSVKMHPARAARVAILHQWTNTQTEGWWRQAFDIYKIPYDYIDPQAIRDTAGPAGEVRRDHLRPRRQPGRRSKACRCGGTPIPVSPVPRDPEHRHVGADRRHADRHGARRPDPPAQLHRCRGRLRRRRTAARSSRSPTASLTASA